MISKSNFVSQILKAVRTNISLFRWQMLCLHMVSDMVSLRFISTFQTLPTPTKTCHFGLQQLWIRSDDFIVTNDFSNDISEQVCFSDVDYNIDRYILLLVANVLPQHDFWQHFSLTHIHTLYIAIWNCQQTSFSFSVRPIVPTGRWEKTTLGILSQSSFKSVLLSNSLWANLLPNKWPK